MRGRRYGRGRAAGAYREGLRLASAAGGWPSVSAVPVNPSNPLPAEK